MTAEMHVGPCSAVREIEVNYGRRGRGRLITRPVRTPGDAAAVAAPFFRAGLPVECFVVVALNARLRPMAGWIVSRGTATESLVHPADVLRPAIVIGASALVIAHNHPSGEVDPSTQDLAVTVRIAAACRILGFNLVDSVILGDGDGGDGGDGVVYWSAAGSRPSVLDGRAADLEVLR